MAEIIDRMELSHHQRVELYEEGVTWLVQELVPDVKAAQAGNEACERQGIDGELGDRPVGARVGLVIEDVHGAIAHLEKIDVPGDAAGPAFG